MKRIFSILALFSTVLFTTAQITTQNSNVLDNISGGVTVGVSTPLDFNSVFPLNTNIGVKFEKDFTPTFGLQLEGLAILNDNHFSNVKTFVKATNVGLNSVFNLSNVLSGYNGTPRFFEVSAVNGVGWLHRWTTSKNYLSAKTGLDFSFNLGKKKASSIVFTPAVYWNLHKTCDIQFDKRGGQLAFNVSFVHHFKTSNGTHYFKLYDIGAIVNELSYLQGELDECHRNNHVDTVTITNIVEKTVVVSSGGTQWVVWFEKSSDVLTDEAKAELEQIGKDMVVEITATASPDGIEEFNNTLSQKRADSVAKYLTNRGIRVEKVVGNGVNPERGRSAVVKPIR